MSFFEDASLVYIPSAVKSGKTYAVKPTDGTGDLTFTRASNATRVNASGLIETVASGVPRLDYQGSTCPKLLLEPQRSNVALRSQELSTSPWGRGTNIATLTVTANQATAPDGTTTAEKLEFSAVTTLSEYAVCFQPFTALASTYTLSVYLRGQSGGETVYLSFTKDGINYTRQLCTLTTAWQRFTLTSTLTAGADNFQIGIDRRDSSQGAAPAQTIFAWGAQLEAGAYATSYIPTTSAAVTRLADACSKTGISSLIGQTEGTIFLEMSPIGSTTSYTERLLKITGGTDEIGFYRYGDSILYVAGVAGGSTSFEIQVSNVFSAGQVEKIAVGYKLNDVVFYVNGTQVGTDTSAAMFTSLANLFFANDASASLLAPQNVKQTLLFKTRLTNAQLAELTTL